MIGRKQSEPWWGACALPVLPTETTTDGNVYELKDWSGTVLETFRELQYRSTYSKYRFEVYQIDVSL